MEQFAPRPTLARFLELPSELVERRSEHARPQVAQVMADALEAYLAD